MLEKSSDLIKKETEKKEKRAAAAKKGVETRFRKKADPQDEIKDENREGWAMPLEELEAKQAKKKPLKMEPSGTITGKMDTRPPLRATVNKKTTGERWDEIKADNAELAQQTKDRTDQYDNPSTWDEEKLRRVGGLLLDKSAGEIGLKNFTDLNPEQQWIASLTQTEVESLAQKIENELKQLNDGRELKEKFERTQKENDQFIAENTASENEQAEHDRLVKDLDDAKARQEKPQATQDQLKALEAEIAPHVPGNLSTGLEKQVLDRKEKLSPEEQARIAALSHSESIRKRTPQHLYNGILGIGDRYNKMSTKKKVLLGLGLSAIGLGLGSRVISGLGMFATLNAATKNRIKNDYVRGVVAGSGAVAFALLAPQALSALNEKFNITGAISDKFNSWINSIYDYLNRSAIAMEPPSVELTPEPPPPLEPPPARSEVIIPTEAPVAIDETFSDAAVVPRGGNIWNMLQDQASFDTDFQALNRAQKIFAIDHLKDILANLSRADVTELGIASGDINKLRPGETLNLQSVLNAEALQEAIERAKALTSNQMNGILRNAR